MSGLDPRVTLAIGDLAAADLEGVTAARAYRTTTRWRAAAPVVALRREPRRNGEQLDQLLFGEAFDSLDDRDGWLYGQARRDGYVGWVAGRQLAPPSETPTHRVSALLTFAFAEPNVRAPANGPFSLNALLVVDAEEGAFVRAAGAGWIARPHVRPLGEAESDFVAIAQRHLGVPYLWGGRSSLGLDCSGLVLQAFHACGLAAPRDSDQQMSLGEPADPDDPGRGDLIFWRGHVGIMADAKRLLHANARHMAVADEALVDACARIAASGGGEILAARRLGPPALAGL